MKKCRRSFGKRLPVLIAVIGIESVIGVVLFAVLLRTNRLSAFLVLLLSASNAVTLFFARHRLAADEESLLEARKELADVKADNELLKLSLGREEEEGRIPSVSDCFSGEASLREAVVASEENTEEGVYRGFGFMPEDLIGYFGKKKAKNSGMAVYHAMSKMDARIRELEEVNRELADRLKHAEKKNNT